MATLAERLDDNAALHRVYAVLAQPRDWSRNLDEARALAGELRRAGGNPPGRDDGQDLLDALASLHSLPRDGNVESLARALRECESQAANPATSLRERDRLLVRQQLLRHRLSSVAAPGDAAIPRVIHLVKTDSSPTDLPLLQYLCYRSVLAHCAGYHVRLHTPAPPRGERWSRLLPHVEVCVARPPQWLGSHRLTAAAHQSDVWRAQQLHRHGGFYFDWDLLLLRSPEHLRHCVCVMALERQEDGFDEVLGVSAIGAMPGCDFLATWLAGMPAAFNPGRYVAHSTKLARELALRHPALIRVLDHRAFYFPGWSTRAMRWLFDPAEHLPAGDLEMQLESSVGIHLFCSHANFLHRASGFTENDIETPRCNLATLLQPYL